MNITQYLQKYLLRVRQGVSFITVQSHGEASAKNGTQWEISRLVEDVAAGATMTSIIKTGSDPVDLRSRVFGYTGVGLRADIYESPTYTGGTETGNTPYNMSRINPATKKFQVLTGFDLTDNGTQCGASIWAIGPESNQSQGATPQSFGANRHLKAETSYLLTFTSLDTLPQDITARLDMYEGPVEQPYPGTV